MMSYDFFANFWSPVICSCCEFLAKRTKRILQLIIKLPNAVHAISFLLPFGSGFKENIIGRSDQNFFDILINIIKNYIKHLVINIQDF